MGSSSAFDLTDISVTGTTFTEPTDVTAAIEGVTGSNLFTLRTGPLEATLRDLPTVESAKVTIALPDDARRRRSRSARRSWSGRSARGATWPVRRRAVRPARREADEAQARACRSSTIAGPSSAGLYVGARLDPVDLDAATRLASLVPADVGSGAVAAWSSGSPTRTASSSGRGPASWAAVFGFYTPSLRTTELIPGQVRLLRSLLSGARPRIDRVILASDTDGTYIAKPTPTPKPKPSP